MTDSSKKPFDYEAYRSFKEAGPFSGGGEQNLIPTPAQAAAQRAPNKTMTISHEYAEELGRQIDELEAENERLREALATRAAAPVETDIMGRSVMQRFLAAAGWDAGSLCHKQLEDALDGAHLQIVPKGQTVGFRA